MDHTPLSPPDHTQFRRAFVLGQKTRGLGRGIEHCPYRPLPNTPPPEDFLQLARAWRHGWFTANQQREIRVLAYITVAGVLLITLATLGLFYFSPALFPSCHSCNWPFS